MTSRYNCYDCGITTEDLMDMYKEESLKRLFMCINHGADIVCFQCFHNEKQKTLFKCPCSSTEHWISYEKS